MNEYEVTHHPETLEPQKFSADRIVVRDGDLIFLSGKSSLVNSPVSIEGAVARGCWLSVRLASEQSDS